MLLLVTAGVFIYMLYHKKAIDSLDEEMSILHKNNNFNKNILES